MKKRLSSEKLQFFKRVSLAKKVDKKVKHTIMNNFYFKPVFSTPFNFSEIFILISENYIYYLLEKLKILNNLIYFKFVKIFNIHEILSCKNISFLEYSSLLYSLIWDNLLYFNEKDNKESNYLFNLLIKKNYLFKNKDKKTSYFNSILHKFFLKNEFLKDFDFNKSLLVDFDYFLQPIDTFKNKKKELKEIEISDSEEAILKDAFEEGISKEDLEIDREEMEIEKEEMEMEKTFSENLYLDLTNKEFLNVQSNLYLLKEKESYLIKKKFLIENCYIENCFLNNINYSLNPYKYIDVKSYKILLDSLTDLSVLEKNFQLKLCVVHNTNLKFLKVPYHINDVKLTNVNFNKDLYNGYTVYGISKIEKSKIYLDSMLVLEFLNKNFLNFIEMFVYKFKNLFSIQKILNNLYVKNFNVNNLIEFYNMFCVNINKKKYSFTTYTISFILDFLNLLYTVITNFSLYENILSFSVLKLKSIFSDLNIFKLYFIKRFILFEFNNDSYYKDFLFNIHSKNFIYNLEYYSKSFENNFFQDFKAYVNKGKDELIHQNIIKSLNINKNLKLYFKKFLFICNFKKLNVIPIDFKKVKQDNDSFKYLRSIYSSYFFKFYKYSKPIVNIEFTSNFFDLFNLYKYKFISLLHILSKPLFLPENLKHVYDNIKILKTNLYTLEYNYSYIKNIISSKVLKNKDLNLFNYIDFWDLLNPLVKITNFSIEERADLFFDYSKFIILLFLKEFKLETNKFIEFKIEQFLDLVIKNNFKSEILKSYGFNKKKKLYNDYINSVILELQFEDPLSKNKLDADS